jgi:hypothetical protein
MAQNSKESKGEKQKRRTIKVEVPVPRVPVPSAAKIRHHARRGHERVKRSLSAPERHAWNTPGAHERRKMELAVGATVVAIVVILVIVFSGPAEWRSPPASGPDAWGGENAPSGWPSLDDLRPRISFERYISGYLYYGDQTISLQGFLRNRIEDAPGGGMGVYEYYLVDDYGSEISLIDLGVLQRSLFVSNGTTADIYNVTGVVKVRYAGFDLRVSSIERA